MLVSGRFSRESCTPRSVPRKASIIIIPTGLSPRAGWQVCDRIDSERAQTGALMTNGYRMRSLIAAGVATLLASTAAAQVQQAQRLTYPETKKVDQIDDFFGT